MKEKKFKRRMVKLEEERVEIRGELEEMVERLKQEEEKFFQTEEMDSSFSYPPGRKIQPIKKQAAILSEKFPELNYEKGSLPALPDAAEGWLIFPNPLKNFSDYRSALKNALSKLGSNRDFVCGREKELGKKYIKLSKRFEKLLIKEKIITRGDFLLAPAQIGLKYVGCSPRRARALFEDNEYGLGPFEIAIFLLTHSDWLTKETDIGIDCAGMRYGPYGHRRFKSILCFYFLDDKLLLNDRWEGCPDTQFGTATAFSV